MSDTKPSASNTKKGKKSTDPQRVHSNKGGNM